MSTFPPMSPFDIPGFPSMPPGGPSGSEGSARAPSTHPRPPPYMNWIMQQMMQRRGQNIFGPGGSTLGFPPAVDTSADFSTNSTFPGCTYTPELDLQRWNNVQTNSKYYTVDKVFRNRLESYASAVDLVLTYSVEPIGWSSSTHNSAPWTPLQANVPHAAELSAEVFSALRTLVPRYLGNTSDTTAQQNLWEKLREVGVYPDQLKSSVEHWVATRRFGDYMRPRTPPSTGNGARRAASSAGNNTSTAAQAAASEEGGGRSEGIIDAELHDSTPRAATPSSPEAGPSRPRHAAVSEEL